MRRSLLPGLVLFPVLAFAQNGYEFQREIQHQRDFQRELDSLASRPSSNLGTAKVDNEAIRKWVEGREAAKNAWRDEEAARQRREEAAQAARETRRRERAEAAASQKRWRSGVNTVAEAIRREGFTSADAESIASSIMAREDGTYLRKEWFRERAERSRVAMNQFHEAWSNGSYDELDRLTWLVKQGVPPAESDDRYVAPLTEIRLLAKMMERFPNRGLDRRLSYNLQKYFESSGPNEATDDEVVEALKIWAIVAEKQPDDRATVGLLIAAGAQRWGVAPNPEAAIPLLTAGWKTSWDDAGRWQTVTPQGPVDNTARNNELYRQAWACAAELGRLYEARGDWRNAALWYVRACYATKERATRRGSPQQGGAVAFFEKHRETLMELQRADVIRLDEAIDTLQSEPLLRAIPALFANDEADRAELNDRVGRRVGDVAMVWTSACYFWGSRPRQAGRVPEFIRALRYVLENDRPDHPKHHRAWLEANAFLALHDSAPFERKRAILQQVKEAGLDEGAYTEARMIGTWSKLPPDDYAHAGKLLAELHARRPVRLWTSPINEPTPSTMYGLWLRADPKGDRLAEAMAVWRESDDPWCRFYLGYQLIGRQRTPAERAEGVKLLRSAAEDNVPDAAGELGVIQLYGFDDVPKDLNLAIRNLREGAANQYDRATYGLGLCYANGWGTTKDTAEALKVWASIRGRDQRPLAMRQSAMLAAADNQLAKALEYAREGAGLGDVISQLLTGTYIYKLHDPALNRADALEWWGKAAAAGNLVAARNIYMARIRGEVVPKDAAQALGEFETFLARCSPQLQYEGALVLLDEHPTIDKIDHVEKTRAEAWLEKASTTVPKAKARLDVLRADSAKS